MAVIILFKNKQKGEFFFGTGKSEWSSSISYLVELERHFQAELSLPAFAIRKLHVKIWMELRFMS